MLQNYFKIAWRNLWKQKGYTFINITGLAVGLASCIIILLYVTHELSYDTHHKKADRIYRVASKIDFSGNYLELATAPAPMGPTLLSDFPEVEAATRFRPRGSYLIRKGDSNIKEDGIVYVDASVFKIFTLPLIHGNPESALDDPNTVVLSASAAKKYFGTTEAVGKSILLEDEHTFTVTGVMKDMPATSHFHFDFLLSMETIDEADQTMWFSNNFRTYLLLKEGTDPDAFLTRFETIKKKYMEAQLKEFMGIDFEQFEAAGNSVEYDLQPLTSIHLYSNLTGEFEANGSITYVYIFSGLALFILLLACINFMNLATARSSQRAKEVGIRKTLGSQRKQLTFQFLSESVLLCLVALLFALLVVEITLPFFSEIAGRDIISNYFSEPLILAGVLGMVLITGLLAGTYPALMLSAFKPVRVLKGTFSANKGHDVLRKSLVVFQFSISMIIVVGLLVINKQLDFIQSKNLGFEKDQVLILNDTYALGDMERVKTFRNEVMTHSIFQNATMSGYLPVEGYGQNDTVYWPEGKDPSEDNTVSMQTWSVDEEYIPTLGMEILEGRNFSEEIASDKNGVILNEAAIKKLGIDNPVGKIIKTFGDDSPDKDSYVSYTILGVVKDFHYMSLRESIIPLGLFYRPNRSDIAFKISPENASAAIGILNTTWKEYTPAQPFSYSFMNEKFDQMYRSENRVQNLMTAFSILAIIIACLGLFGLSAYSAERRTKEIGIRKVLGASTENILGLMSKEFVQLVLVSFLIAVPLAWIFMQQWLQEFTYRTEIGIGVFVLAGIGMLSIALITVSWQSIRAAFKNPVESLRSE